MPNPPDTYRGRTVARHRRVHSPYALQGHARRFFDLRYRSVLRGTLVVLLSTFWAFRLSHFPNNARNGWLVLPLLFAVAGTADTTRCMQKRWTWYHGGVVLCLYTDLMAICMIMFFLLYPLSL